jgi:hypothetical protein
VILSVGLALVASYALLKPGSSLPGRIAAVVVLAFCIWRIPVDMRRRVEVTGDGLTLVAWRTRRVRWNQLQRVEFFNGGRSLGARIAGDRLWRMLLVGKSESGRQEVQALAATIAFVWSGTIAGAP